MGPWAAAPPLLAMNAAWRRWLGLAGVAAGVIDIAANWRFEILKLSHSKAVTFHRRLTMMRLRRLLVIALPACSLIVTVGAFSVRKAGCRVQGVWEMEAVTNNGKDQPLNGARQVKIVTRRHFMWVGQDARRDTLPLKTQADTLRRNTIGGGAGTYSVTGNAYVEQIDVFNDPSWLGKPWKATCRVEGDRWYHSYPFPQDSAGVPRDSIAHIVEVWRRVE